MVPYFLMAHPERSRFSGEVKDLARVMREHSTAPYNASVKFTCT